MRGMAETDPRVERDLLEYSVVQYFTNIDTSLFGPYQRELSAKFGTDFKAMTDYIWAGTMVASRETAQQDSGAEQGIYPGSL